MRKLLLASALFGSFLVPAVSLAGNPAIIFPTVENFATTLSGTCHAFADGGSACFQAGKAQAYYFKQGDQLWKGHWMVAAGKGVPPIVMIVFENGEWRADLIDLKNSTNIQIAGSGYVPGEPLRFEITRQQAVK